jgi:biopolymer transport protein ExbD
MLGLSRRRKRRVTAEINITPFTDVVLVLLIIFMITTPLLSSNGAAARSDNGFSVDLPKARPGGISGKGGKVTVTILKDGRIATEDRVITEGTLEDQLRRAKTVNPDVMVVVQADRMVAHWHVIRVMNLATRLGIKRLAIATDEENTRGEE